MRLCFFAASLRDQASVTNLGLWFLFWIGVCDVPTERGPRLQGLIRETGHDWIACKGSRAVWQCRVAYQVAHGRHWGQRAAFWDLGLSNSTLVRLRVLVHVSHCVDLDLAELAERDGTHLLDALGPCYSYTILFGLAAPGLALGVNVVPHLQLSDVHVLESNSIENT